MNDVWHKTNQIVEFRLEPQMFVRAYTVSDA